MGYSRNIRIIIAEHAPVISGGIGNVIRKFSGIRPHITEVTNKETLLEILISEEIDILIASPAFDGLLHPDEIRKKSLNPSTRIIAIEIGKLSPQALALYDDHIHVTDDLTTITKILFPPTEEKEIKEEKDTLSSREKEIVSLVVKGYTNQEIADKLFLSIHTVITHRRNIARKLEIHSATGLTIYAIVNKIVDLREIKL